MSSFPCRISLSFLPSYFKVVLDPASLSFSQSTLEKFSSPLLRQLLWQTFYNMTRDAKLKRCDSVSASPASGGEERRRERQRERERERDGDVHARKIESKERYRFLCCLFVSLLWAGRKSGWRDREDHRGEREKEGNREREREREKANAHLLSHSRVSSPTQHGLPASGAREDRVREGREAHSDHSRPRRRRPR